MESTEKLDHFLKCCREQNVEEVEQILSNGIVDLYDKQIIEMKVNHPLVLAVEDDSINMVKILLKYGAEVNTGYPKYTPLYVACYKGNYEIVKILINYGAEVNVPEYKSSSPLFGAFIAKNTSAIKLLLEKGAKNLGNFKSVWGVKSILDCLDEDFDMNAFNVVKLLLDYKILDMVSIFHEAITRGLVTLVEYIVDKGVDVNATIKSDDKYFGLTPLVASFLEWSTNQFEIATILLKAGADPNIQCIGRNGYYEIPFTNAAMYGSWSLPSMKTLLQFGANINSQEGKGCTALHFWDCRDQEVLRFLISRGIKTDIRNKEGKTAEETFLGEGLEMYQRTMNEISKMESITLNNYGLNLHNILLMNRHELSRYVQNTNLTKIFKQKNFLCKFPIFGRTLKEKFFLAKERKYLMDCASKFIENLTGVKVPQLHVMIFKYLSNGEIKSTFLTD